MPKVSVQTIAPQGKGSKNNGWSDFEAWSGETYFTTDNKKERKTPKAPKMPKLKK